MLSYWIQTYTKFKPKFRIRNMKNKTNMKKGLEKKNSLSRKRLNKIYAI